MKRRWFSLFLVFLGGSSLGVESSWRAVGPFGQGIEMTQLFWWTDDVVLVVEDDDVLFVRWKEGEVSKSPLEGTLLAAKDGEWLVQVEGPFGAGASLLMGVPGEELVVGNAPGRLSGFEVAWPDDSFPFARQWLDYTSENLNLGPPVGRGISVGTRAWLFDPQTPGTLYGLGEEQTLLLQGKGEVRLGTVAADRDGNVIGVETRNGSSRIVWLDQEGVRFENPWIEKSVIGLFGGEDLGWRLSPRLPEEQSQSFCSNGCKDVPKGYWLQSKAWSMGQGEWLLALTDLRTVETVLMTFPSWEEVARVEKFRLGKLSPDGSAFAFLRATAQADWDWDLVILEIPSRSTSP
ncbi:hypothetical protein H8D30_00925 [bacterium]|nr:hypothetical protein [bacterium]